MGTKQTPASSQDCKNGSGGKNGSKSTCTDDSDDDSDQDGETEEPIHDYDYEALEHIWMQTPESSNSPGKKRQSSIDNDGSATASTKVKQEGKKKNNNTASGPDSTAKKPKDCKRNLQNSSDLQIKSSGKSSASKGKSVPASKKNSEPESKHKITESASAKPVKTGSSSATSIITSSVTISKANNSSAPGKNSNNLVKTHSLATLTPIEPATLTKVPVNGSTDDKQSRRKRKSSEMFTNDSSKVRFSAHQSSLSLDESKTFSASQLRVSQAEPEPATAADWQPPLSVPPAAQSILHWARALSAAGSTLTPASQPIYNNFGGPPAHADGLAVLAAAAAAAAASSSTQSTSTPSITMPMVRMDYSKHDKGAVLEKASLTSTGKKPSLFHTIERLKDKLGCAANGDSTPVLPPSTSFNNCHQPPVSSRSTDLNMLSTSESSSIMIPPPSIASLVSAAASSMNGSGQAEHVLNLLMTLGLPPTQPLALFERMLCTVRPGATLTQHDTESLVLLLVKHVAQFVQLQSQLSPTHQQILRLAAKTKHAETPEYWNRLLSHLRLLSSQQLLYLTHQFTRLAPVPTALNNPENNNSILQQLKRLSD